jgi:hypothetical protein
MLDNRQLFVGKHVYEAFAGYGDKRKQLVLRHGYDSKNAAHLIRLLRMCVEFMKNGELVVSRPDAAELLDIKAGKWTLEQVKRTPRSCSPTRRWPGSGQVCRKGRIMRELNAC